MDTPATALLHAACLAITPEERSATLRLPDDSAFFAGHFPGQPILPAIGQLQLVSDLLPHWFPEASHTLRQLASLRFQRPLGPGATFQIQLGEPTAEGRASLLIRQDDAIVSRGAVVLGEATDGAAPNLEPPPVGNSPTGDFPLPHVGPARWISRILKRAPDQLRAEVRVPASSAFCRESRVNSATSIEAAAQAAALLEALQRTDQAGDGQAEARTGYLVGAQRVELQRSLFPADAPLEVEVKLAGQAGPLAKYDFELEQVFSGETADIRLATGQVSTFIAPAEA